MSGSFTPMSFTDDGPRLGTSLIFRGVLRRQHAAPGVADTVLAAQVTGRLTVERDGVKIVDNQLTAPDPTYGVGGHSYLVSHTLMTRGTYTWSMILTENATGLASTGRGRFNLR